LVFIELLLLSLYLVDHHSISC